MMEGFIAAIVLICTFGLGWVYANHSIALECNKLGQFYIGETVYECKVKRVGDSNG